MNRFPFLLIELHFVRHNHIRSMPSTPVVSLSSSRLHPIHPPDSILSNVDDDDDDDGPPELIILLKITLPDER